MHLDADQKHDVMEKDGRNAVRAATLLLLEPKWLMDVLEFLMITTSPRTVANSL